MNGSMHAAWAGREDNRQKGCPREGTRVYGRLDMIRHVAGMTPGLVRGVIARFTVCNLGEYGLLGKGMKPFVNGGVLIASAFLDPSDDCEHL